ncbi:biopolymer transporter ExbD [bacterium]|nr:biopolymer transporter ExbD [bacterium]
MGKRAEAPSVNAGSMADIAFLLLIFFLVTTTIETDAGLARMLPSTVPTPPILKHNKNILEVSLNKNNELMVEGKEIPLAELRQTAIAFIDNGGEQGTCDYCKGEKLEDSSENPLVAIIAVKNDRETTYEAYIAVQNELVVAYHALRNREGQYRYKQDYTAMEKSYNSPQATIASKQQLKTRIKELQDLYPLHIVEPKN